MTLYLHNSPQSDWRDEDSQLLPNRPRNDFKALAIVKKRSASKLSLKLLTLPLMALVSTAFSLTLSSKS